MATCRYCGASLEGRREGTRFCDSTCRSAAWHRRHPERGHRGETPASVEGNVYRASLSASDGQQAAPPKQGRTRCAALRAPRGRHRDDPREGQGGAPVARSKPTHNASRRGSAPLGTSAPVMANSPGRESEQAEDFPDSYWPRRSAPRSRADESNGRKAGAVKLHLGAFETRASSTRIPQSRSMVVLSPSVGGSTPRASRCPRTQSMDKNYRP